MVKGVVGVGGTTGVLTLTPGVLVALAPPAPPATPPATPPAPPAALPAVRVGSTPGGGAVPVPKGKPAGGDTPAGIPGVTKPGVAPGGTPPGQNWLFLAKLGGSSGVRRVKFAQVMRVRLA